MENLMTVMVDALYQQSKEIDRQDQVLSSLEKTMAEFMEDYKDELKAMAEEAVD